MYSRNAVKYNTYDNYYVNNGYYDSVTLPAKPVKEKKLKPTKPKRRKKASLIAKLITFSLLACVGYLLIPTAYHMYQANFLSNKLSNIEETNNLANTSFEANSGVNYSEMINPTLAYTTNYTFLNKRIDYPVNKHKKSQMSNLKFGTRLTGLENQLKSLNNKYSNVKPSVFVWSIDNQSYASIDSKAIYPAASIIKLPVLIQLYKSIEVEQFGLNDIMYLTEYYRSSGSGDIQYAQCGRPYSVFDLARLMIQDSDNTATNMLMSKLGSMNDTNAALKNWGISHTHIQTWLPDLTGTNYTTAEDMAKMLYNITDDNNSFLNVNSQSDIINIMGKVKNVNLIKAGLPENVDFIHKTGDIGTMVGDAGVVYLPSGERYIIVIMVKRPYNHYNGKLYIQEASRIIYNYMTKK